jgi:hypothetical protein
MVLFVDKVILSVKAEFEFMGAVKNKNPDTKIARSLTPS